MHRIDGPGATIDNLFTEGDPTQGVPATTVTGAWLNSQQEEIANAIEGAGLTLDKLDNTQLYQAIVSLVLANQQIGFDTGDVKLTLANTAPAGWLMCDDGTIGNSSSVATSRANDDCEALFILLWQNVSDGFAPVSGGRGGSAQLDWAAGKTIGLTKMLGRSLALAGAGIGLTARQLGQTVGAEAHKLTAGEMPTHTHANTLSDAGHTHGNTLTDPGHVHANTLSDPGHVHSMGYQFGGTAGGGAAGQAGVFYSTPTNTQAAATGISINNASKTTGMTLNNASAASGVTINNASQGGDGSHNNMQPTAFLNAMVKL